MQYDLAEIQKQLARKQYLRYMQYCWRKADPLVVGLHTRMICERIDKALEDFRNGKSSYIRIKIHQRAGKSDLVSRHLPSRFIAEFPDCDVMDVSFSKTKAEGFSRSGMRLVESTKFKELYPDVELNRSAAGNWNVATRDEDTNGLTEREGQVLACGLTSGLSGDGAHLAILDDYCGSRADAESPGIRETTWQEFTNSFLSRLAPVHIVIVLATQWHEDDIHGRIDRRNDPEDEEYDEDFPKYEVMSFPARKSEADPEIAKHYPGEYLFLERYSAAWYKGQYAQLGPYASSAMMDCDPVPREGGILKTSGIVYHDNIEDFPQIPYFRVWDYAHSAVKRLGKQGKDPDYTGGTWVGYERGKRNPANNLYMWKIWVLDYTQFREQAVKRDNRIRKVADGDGKLTKILVETSLDSKDGYIYLKNQLGGIYSVLPVNPRGDKVVRCTPIEPIFEAGNVHALKGPWNTIWEKGLKKFDGSGKTHDEMVDNLTAGFEYASHYIPQNERSFTYGRT